MKTKKEYEKYLNEILTYEANVINGRAKEGRKGTYGTWLRKNDPIAFEVSFSDWEQEN